MKQISGEEKSVLEKDIRPWLDLTLSQLFSQFPADYITMLRPDTITLHLKEGKTERSRDSFGWGKYESTPYNWKIDFSEKFLWYKVLTFGI